MHKKVVGSRADAQIQSAGGLLQQSHSHRRSSSSANNKNASIHLYLLLYFHLGFYALYFQDFLKYIHCLNFRAPRVSFCVKPHYCYRHWLGRRWRIWSLGTWGHRREQQIRWDRTLECIWKSPTKMSHFKSSQKYFQLWFSKPLNFLLSKLKCSIIFKGWIAP